MDGPPVYPRIRTISFDCHDTYTLAGFRSAVLVGRCVLRSAGERVATTTVEDHQ
ncbi:hypothetical protein O7631_13245 [Micromonospora sp. WMMD967]|uniref:hypothetical protein n=1 Tax=Micromonospora sp. WMMD967 TaxID=3016101 RepID=UPI002417BED9|nr:hypothetical protein [Micromonospora sp. WMMD967]MDG4837485.1 hypothetical protein [Micromonospora sp. WMMD967]